MVANLRRCTVTTAATGAAERHAVIFRNALLADSHTSAELFLIVARSPSFPFKVARPPSFPFLGIVSEHRRLPSFTEHRRLPSFTEASWHHDIKGIDNLDRGPFHVWESSKRAGALEQWDPGLGKSAGASSW